MPDTTSTAPIAAPLAAATGPDLGLTMTQVLRNPLSALRASMETLASEFRSDDPRSLKLSGALEQVLSMSRDVDALLALTAPRPLAPLTCRIDEILEAALRQQGFEGRSRVQLAQPERDATLSIDGPLLADCLARLIEHALANSCESVLVSVSARGASPRFSIVAQADDSRRACATHQRLAALDLGLALARRDAARMGAALELSRSALGRICIALTCGDGDAAHRAATPCATPTAGELSAG